ncbi:MAG TPA: class I SAM-dependent methyltransferase, partial [Pseudonocardiaceae bacterium]
LALPHHESTHHVLLRPAGRAVELIAPAAAQLRLHHGAAEFVDLFRATFGGRRDLGAAIFGQDDQPVAKTLAAGFAERPGLDELAARHGSCKWGAHWQSTDYERYLAPLRDQRLTILEIGIGGHHVAPGGQSLRMWRDYFPRARIYGIDLYDKHDVAEQRIGVFQGDQSDVRFLSDVVAGTGPLDIVIDDGSHVNEHVLTAFRFLFPRLNDGGLYLIDDLQSAYWPAFGGVPDDRDDPRTTTGFLKTLCDGLQHQEFLWPTDYQPSYLDQNVAGVHVHHLFAAIEKGANTAPSSKPNWMRYLDLNRPMAALEIGPQP